jgi:hypothetical protein
MTDFLEDLEAQLDAPRKPKLRADCLTPSLACCRAVTFKPPSCAAITRILLAAAGAGSRSQRRQQQSCSGEGVTYPLASLA